MELHEDLKPFRSMFFITEVTELHKNIGRKVRFKNPTCLCEKEEHQIKMVQKIFDGSYSYRVYSTEREDTFGCPARPEIIEFLD